MRMPFEEFLRLLGLEGYEKVVAKHYCELPLSVFETMSLDLVVGSLGYVDSNSANEAALFCKLKTFNNPYEEWVEVEKKCRGGNKSLFEARKICHEKIIGYIINDGIRENFFELKINPKIVDRTVELRFNHSCRYLCFDEHMLICKHYPVFSRQWGRSMGYLVDMDLTEFQIGKIIKLFKLKNVDVNQYLSDKVMYQKKFSVLKKIFLLANGDAVLTSKILSRCQVRKISFNEWEELAVASSNFENKRFCLEMMCQSLGDGGNLEEWRRICDLSKDDLPIINKRGLLKISFLENNKKEGLSQR